MKSQFIKEIRKKFARTEEKRVNSQKLVNLNRQHKALRLLAAQYQAL